MGKIILLRITGWSAATVAVYFTLLHLGILMVTPSVLRDEIDFLFDTRSTQKAISGIAPEQDHANASSTIFIPTAGIASPVEFPKTANIEILKRALNKGVVHYPYSHLPSDDRGNVFIFGHSSANLHESNPARRVFSYLPTINTGEKIELSYQGVLYSYRVRSVRILKPTEAEIFIDAPGRLLTLSTCWPIGDPSHRFIVEAEFMESYPLRATSAADSSS